MTSNVPEVSLRCYFSVCLLFLISCFQALASPNEMRPLVNSGLSPPGVGFGQGRVSRMDIWVSDNVGRLYQGDSAVLSPPSTRHLLSQAPNPVIPEVTLWADHEA